MSGANTSAASPGEWVFPVPDLGERRAEVSDGWGSPRHDDDGTRRLHLGADIMFRRHSRTDLIDAFGPETTNGSPGYFMPHNIPALAASGGVVTFAAWTARGFTVKIRHTNRWTTYYTHLALLFVRPGQTVAVGDPIGTIGFDPSGRRRLMHLHMELWRGPERWAAVNPAPYLAAWHRVEIEWTAPRNATAFRSPGKAGERYPEWLQALGDKSGAYVIREKRGGKTVTRYVGESHTRRLYDSLTRHMQIWRRSKGFRKGQYGEGNDPGITYDRDKIEIAVAVTKPNAATTEKLRLIRTMRPTDNVHGQPREDAA